MQLNNREILAYDNGCFRTKPQRPGEKSKEYRPEGLEGGDGHKGD